MHFDPDSRANSPDTICWTLFRYTWNSRGIKCVIHKISGLQKGPAERGHVKKRQKSSKTVKKFFDTFRPFSRRAKNVKNRQKVSKSFSTLFDNFRAAPFFRPLLQSAETPSAEHYLDTHGILGELSAYSIRAAWYPL